VSQNRCAGPWDFPRGTRGWRRSDQPWREGIHAPRSRAITALLQKRQTSLPLERCLPPIPKRATERPIRTRAALASTLVAGLELARDGHLAMEQHEAFEAISLLMVSA
jgi:chromatin segregation and condensation protein Rec8/ScpA/Scc1 (kleisin family)